MVSGLFSKRTFYQANIFMEGHLANGDFGKFFLYFNMNIVMIILKITRLFLEINFKNKHCYNFYLFHYNNKIKIKEKV
jgi:hypothetical protein